ncbi:MAG TPA: hypothetical protein VN282_15020 [Pyrinomonadaceae bacterium]|nr:hypothetical protein [Pyrinomonadaceae bacterium]
MFTAIFVILVFGFVVFPYGIAPLVVRFVHKQSARPEVEQVGADAFCPELAAYFGRVAACLAPLGFAPAAYVRVTDAAARTEIRALLLTNESARESAAAFELQGKGPVQSFSRHVEFCTEFVNGDELGTHNCGMAFVFKPHPKKRLFRFPGVQHPQTLHRAHRRLVERHRPPAEPFVPTRGTEHLHLLHSFEKTYGRQAEFGYLFLDEAAGVYRPTLKGAFLMSWKLAWPVKQAREALARRSETVMLRRLGA